LVGIDFASRRAATLRALGQGYGKGCYLFSFLIVSDTK
jgi:hypothetical protein